MPKAMPYVSDALTAVHVVAPVADLPALPGRPAPAGAAIVLALQPVVRPPSGWMSLATSNLAGHDRWGVSLCSVPGIGSIHYRACRAGKVGVGGEDSLWTIFGFAWSATVPIAPTMRRAVRTRANEAGRRQ